MPDIDDFTFNQFLPSIWIGIILSLIGLFLTGYYSKRKSIKALCASLFPIILYSYSYFFPILTSPDIGNVRGMFEVFHQVGINSDIVSYFQYPIYFSLNEISSQILGFEMEIISALFFALFGILIGLFLFLFLSKIKKNMSGQIAFLAVPLYFIGLFSFINYQWVPQTLALVFFFLLLVLLDQDGVEYKLFSIVIFTTLAFTHAFIPTIYLIFFGFYVLKKRELTHMFLLMICIYSSILIYYTTFYFPVIAETFSKTIYSFGSDYNFKVSRSFEEPSELMSQIISLVNRVRVPLVWLVVTTGSFVEFLKKRLHFKMIALGVTSGVYLGFGFFYPILGMRALQILLVALVIGICFFIKRWKKLTLLFIFVVLILSVFGPMRGTYSQTQFQLDEEKNACSFLANTLPTEGQKTVAIGQVNWGYFTISFKYQSGSYIEAYRPGNMEFYQIFNSTIEENGYILYNPNLGKEIVSYGAEMEEINNIVYEKISNNKIYECGKTLIIAR